MRAPCGRDVGGRREGGEGKGGQQKVRGGGVGEAQYSPRRRRRHPPLGGGRGLAQGKSYP